MAQKQKKVDRRTQYTCAAIKNAFLELVSEIGFEKVTVTGICKRAEITRATFYLHYKNVAEVLDEVMDDALEMGVGVQTGEAMQISKKALDGAVSTEDGAHVNNVARNSKKAQDASHSFDALAYFPTCQRISADERYRPLFLDKSLANYIVGRLFRVESERQIPDIMLHTGLPRKQAERLLLFVIHGSFALNNSFGWQRSQDWRALQDVINCFTQGGFDAVRRGVGEK